MPACVAAVFPGPATRKTAAGRMAPGDFKCRLSTVVVHLICNQGVVGSNPTAGTIDFNDIR